MNPAKESSSDHLLTKEQAEERLNPHMERLEKCIQRFVARDEKKKQEKARAKAASTE